MTKSSNPSVTPWYPKLCDFDGQCESRWAQKPTWKAVRVADARSLREKKISHAPNRLGDLFRDEALLAPMRPRQWQKASIQLATQSPTLQALGRGAYSKGSFIPRGHSKGVIPRGYVVKDAQLMPERCTVDA